MPVRTAFLALIVLLVAGCSFVHPRAERASKKLDCDGNSACAVVVTATCSYFYGCELSAEYDLVLVLSPRGKPLEIRWQLAGEAGAEFSSDGIGFDSSVFSCKPEGRRTFVCADTNPEFGVFKYTVNVTVRDSALGPRGVQSLDPWVVNR